MIGLNTDLCFSLQYLSQAGASSPTTQTSRWWLVACAKTCELPLGSKPFCQDLTVIHSLDLTNLRAPQKQPPWIAGPEPKPDDLIIGIIIPRPDIHSTSVILPFREADKGIKQSSSITLSSHNHLCGTRTAFPLLSSLELAYAKVAFLSGCSNLRTLQTTSWAYMLHTELCCLLVMATDGT